jgi:AraC-like DNA-binding protein
MAHALFSFRQLPTVAAMLAERGLALDALMTEAGFRAPAATEVTAPLYKVQVLLELVAEKLANPMFGLDLAARLPEGAFGVTEFVVRTSPTIEHALRAMCELSPLINPALDMRYIADELGCEIRFSYSDEREALGDILNEYTIGYIARQFSIVLGRPLPLVRAWFAHARSNGHDEIARRLGCPVTFFAADCGLAVASDVIHQTTPAGNEALYKFLLAQGRAQLATVGKHDVISQVTRAIEARIAEPNLSAQTIASALELSQRSLQRQLTEAGTTYRALLASIRRRRRDELDRAGLSDGEIATRLGFANAKTMRRSLDDATEATEDAEDA